MKPFGIFEKLYKPVQVEEEDPALGVDAEEEETGEEEEGDPEEEEDEDDEESSESSALEAKQALELYKALNNPETAPGILAYLNAQLTAKGLSTVSRADIKEISISDILKEGFGEEYSFLNEKLTPAFEKAMNALVDQKLAPHLQKLNESNQRLSQQVAETKISSALDPIIEEMGAAEFDKIAPQLEKVMQKYPNTQNLPMKTYIRDMIQMVNSKPTNTEKIRKNVREARRNPANGVETKTVKTGSRTPSIREAVQAAMRGETFED